MTYKEAEHQIAAYIMFKFDDMPDDVKTALSVLQEAARRGNAREWVSVKDRLPETNDEFLLYGKIHEDEDYHIFIGPFDDDAFGVWEMTSGGFDDFFPFAEVLAWQPLPKPYEEEKHEDTKSK